MSGNDGARLGICSTRLEDDAQDETMLHIEHLVEAGIYADDLSQAEAFYRDVLGLEVVMTEPGRHVFFRAGQSMLLVFDPTTTLKGETLPPHGCTGPSHFALGIPTESLKKWKERLVEHGVEIEREVRWPKGGQSIYFRDPAGNSVELVTRGLWGLPSGW
jgi:catechol 2,3-dioxygenase-like lactoylglutathione lyase family enzyme